MSKKLTSPTRTYDGVVYQLKNLTICEELSEETLLFGGDLFADGKKIGYFKNDGHGGCTDGYLEPDVRDLGAKLNESLGKYHTFPGAEKLQDVMLNLEDLAEMLAYDTLAFNDLKSKQSNRLILRKGREYYTRKLPFSIRTCLSDHYKTIGLRMAIQQVEKDGYEVLNTNIKFQ
jgi:hypothetical protein